MNLSNAMEKVRDLSLQTVGIPRRNRYSFSCLAEAMEFGEVVTASSERRAHENVRLQSRR